MATKHSVSYLKSSYDNNSCVLGIYINFKLCNMWITDTSYCNKRLLRNRTRNNPVHLAPIMMRFTKDEETSRRFCIELISANSQLINLKNFGADMEVAIFNKFQSVICNCNLHNTCSKEMKRQCSYHKKISVGLKLTTRKSFSSVSSYAR